MVSNPIVGSLSDRTSSRMGMRRPWVVGGAICATSLTVVIAFAPSILLVGVAWPLLQLSIQPTVAGLAAFLPDQVPERQRGRVAALTGIAQQLSPFVGLVIANVALTLGGGTAGMLLAPALVALILILLFAAVAPDRVLAKSAVAPFHLSSLAKALVFDPRRHPDFGWVWLGRFLVSMAFAVNLTYGAYFLNARLGIPLEQVVTAQLAFLLLTTVLLSVSATIVGMLCDKLKRRKPFVMAASLLVATSSLLVAFSHDFPLYIVATVISGLATGAYYTVDLALATDVLPNKDTSAAKGMGILNIADLLPQALAPAMAAGLLAIGGGEQNYTVLFMAAAAVSALGALTVIPIKGAR